MTRVCSGCDPIARNTNTCFTVHVMKTLNAPNKIAKSNNLQKMILAELRDLDSQKNLCETFLKKLGGIGEIREQELSTRKTGARKSPKRGAPLELLENLREVNGTFTVDEAMGVARRNKLEYSRTDVMNYLQALIKLGKVKVVEPGIGRRIAIYEVAGSGSKSIKQAEKELAN